MVSKEATLDVAEAVIDAVDETVETLERVPHLALNGTTRKQQIVILTAVAVTAGGVGAAVSHLVTRKMLGLKFDALLEQEIDAARRHYTVMAEKPDLLEEVAGSMYPAGAPNQEYLDAVSEYAGNTPPLETPTVVEDESGELHHVDPNSTVNVFQTHTVVGQWDQAVEESKRDPSAPYVISRDEFFSGENDYEQEQLTFYQGDDTLAEMSGDAVPVHDVDPMVGEGNLLRFGHGSGDEDIVYVRNDKLEIEYEITKATGKYAYEVAGFLQHDDGDGGVRKFRRFDE